METHAGDHGHVCGQGSQEILRQYDRAGFVILRDVIDADLINEVQAHVDWLQRSYPDARPEQLGRPQVRLDAFWVSLAADDRLLDIAELFVGPDIALFASHYIVKPPYRGRAILWHKDGSHWPLEPMEAVTIWLAVDPATPDNGCLRVIPGTHRQTADEVDESQAVDVVLDAGDVEVHHPNVLHGSRPNTSPQRRCGLTMRYIPTSTRIASVEQPYPSAFHLRGRPGVNVYQPLPEPGMLEQTIRGSPVWLGVAGWLRLWP